jgi:hypothetical protein
VCDNPSGPPALHPVVSDDLVALSLFFYAAFYRSLFVRLFFFVWPLYYLRLFDL